MIALTSFFDAFAHPLDLPAAFGVFNGITTGPSTPATPLWMWAAAAGPDRSRAVIEKQTCGFPARRRIVALPVATGSPAGLSASPTSTTLKTRVGARSVRAFAATIPTAAARAATASTTARRLMDIPLFDFACSYAEDGEPVFDRRASVRL